MPLLFILSLATCFAAIYVFQHSDNEIAYFAIAITLVSIVLSLVSAPWPLLLLLLIVILVSNRRQAISPQDVVNSEADETNKLIYRGGNYKPNPSTTEVNVREINGKYRGKAWKSHTLVKVP